MRIVSRECQYVFLDKKNKRTRLRIKLPWSPSAQYAFLDKKNKRTRLRKKKRINEHKNYYTAAVFAPIIPYILFSSIVF